MSGKLKVDAGIADAQTVYQPATKAHFAAALALGHPHTLRFLAASLAGAKRVQRRLPEQMPHL